MGGTTSTNTPMHGLGYGLPLSRLYTRLLNQSDQLLSDPKKHFVCEVYFCQKKYIFDSERSTNCAKSSFSIKIIYESPHF